VADATQIAVEQEYFDHAAECRERSRATLIAAPANAAGPIAGASAVKRNIDEYLARMAGPDEAVAIGRFETQDQTLYVGKRRISDDDGEPLVINWQAKAAAPFYSATFDEPIGVLRKRSFTTEKNRVLDFDETVFADLAGRVAALTSNERLGINDTVLRDLDEDRTGEMRDIVQTIHASQYHLIRQPLDRLLIVQGGPGTGKSVVALHRVSWLLFNEESLAPSDVLVIGPNPTFTKYISSVLPGLGDHDVQHKDILSLGPQRSDGREEDRETAELKGLDGMVGLLERALHQRLRLLPDGTRLEIVPGVALGMAEVNQAASAAIDAANYNSGRQQFRAWVERAARNATRHPEALTATIFDNAVERVWPALTPQSFLQELLGSRERLTAAAGDEFRAGDINRLYRQASERISDERWSDSDVALLDEAELLIRGSSGFDIYGHIVVDEAQDLSPMQLRSIRRRSTTGSLTLVGDLAQATSPWAPDTWDSIANQLRKDAPVAQHTLELGYRVPRQIYELAAQLLPFAAPNITPPQAIREGPSEPTIVEVDRDDTAKSAVDAAREYAGRGLFVGIVCPEALHDDVVDQLRRQGVSYADTAEGRLGKSINLVSPTGSKGLEFDAAIVVGPELIGGHDPVGLRTLYVALTRTTRYLTIVHTGVVLPLPSPEPTVRTADEPRQSGVSAKTVPVSGVDTLTVSTPRPNRIAAGIAVTLAEDIRSSTKPELWPVILEELRRQLGLYEQR
jgi:DNA helicase IV